MTISISNQEYHCCSHGLYAECECDFSLLLQVPIACVFTVLQGEESVDKPGKLYKPTSKLIEKKAASLTKPKEEEKPERPVSKLDCAYNRICNV